MAQTREQRRLVRLASSYNKRARRFGARGVLFAVDLASKPPHCQYCGIGLEEGQGTFDHIISLKRGGTNTTDNIVRCCITCNRTKFDKTPDEFEAHRRLVVSCVVCGKEYQPRWAEYQRGKARTCSLSCAAKSRYQPA